MSCGRDQDYVCWVDLIARMVSRSQESAEQLVEHQTARRANAWREGPNSEVGIDWVEGRPVAGRHPSDREGVEHL